MILVLLLSTALAGPLSKFDKRQPSVSVETSRSIYDVERCLMDTDGPPAIVYRQPDKPDAVQIIWSVENSAVARADLTKLSSGRTKLVGWLVGKDAKACAPAK